jgi:hypothetical protein
MNTMSSQNSRLLVLVLTYIEVIKKVTSYLFVPISDFLEPYSKSLSRTVEIISEIISNFLILSPILGIALGIGIGIFGFESSIEDFMHINFQITIGIIIIFSSVLAFTLSQESDADLSQSIYIFLLLLMGGGSVIYFNPPELYAVLFGVLYGIGGYTIAYINYENPLSHRYIYEDLEPHKRIRRLSYLLVGISAVLYFSSRYLASEGYSSKLTIAPMVIIPILAFITTTIQSKSYEQIYKHAGINTKSPIWILTPRLLIILGVTISVSTMEVTILSLLLFLTPSIFGFMFSYYIIQQTEMVFGKTTFTDSDLYVEPHRVTGYESAKVETEFNDNENTAVLDAHIQIDITGDIPDNKTGPWIEATESSKHMIKALESLSRIENEELEELREFNRKSLEKSASKYDGDLSELPEEVAKEFAYIMTKNSEKNLQDICDLDIKIQDLNKKPSDEYIDSNPPEK